MGLKACPFCESEDVKQYSDYSIHCRQCGAESGVSWNNRPIEDRLLSEIAGLRAKHNDYEHPRDSIDRGNRISQLEIDKHNLRAQLAEARAEVERLKEEIDGLNRDIGIIERGK